MPPKADAQASVVERFHRFDKNGDGVISKKELANVLKVLDPNRFNDYATGQLLKHADKRQH